MSIYEMTIRTLASFVVLFIMSRILGKKLISQMTFFDFIAGVTLGTVAGSIMFSSTIPLQVGLFGMILFTLFTLTLGIISLKSYKGRKIIDDEPTLVVRNGKIYEEGMKKARLNMDQLLWNLRKKNIFYLDEVALAFFETDGTISALKKSDKMPVTRTDMQIPSSSRGLPQTFIIDGYLLENSLDSLGKDKAWVDSIMKTNGISDISEITVAQMDEKGKLYIDKKKD